MYLKTEQFKIQVAGYYEATAAEKLKTVEKRCSVVAVDKEIAIGGSVKSVRHLKDCQVSRHQDIV